MTITDQPATFHQPPTRLNALHEATILHSSFFHRPPDAADTPSSSPPRNERICLGGHRETIFGISFSPDGKYLATASQDSTIRIWESRSNRLVETLSEGMDVNYECLRVAWRKSGLVKDANAEEEETYLLASAGADGILRLWSAIFREEREKLQWKLVGTKDHYQLLDSNASASETEDRPQIYSLQFVQSPSFPNSTLLMTSADDAIFLWNIKNSIGTDKTKEITSHLSLQFSHLDPSLATNVNQFGGPRNPDNDLFVFDASYSEVNDLVGAALSDGTCRIVSLSHSGGPNDETQDREHGHSLYEKQCVLSLPANYFPGTTGGHLTALSWDSSGTRVATCIASGKVVLWSIQMMMREDGSQFLYPSCAAILEGGHDVHRPLFGARYYGRKNEELVLTWGVDGKVCVWDSYSVGLVTSPLCTLISHSAYPIYALDFTQTRSHHAESSPDLQRGCLAIGGGSDGGFLGVPAYLYDI
ncbi:hypothetical protein HJC23_009847 [Cyclotella cryptica]|uniref:WD40 repeat-like protein n=1 Tax=Cyclotella cryptica TaxID=29204 RepID=A0ABD3NTR9_9STRA|eukprot:CCRYP_019983-RA/>CCRYP_019983-RA protein AED:0.19 eAED:0.19 QI:126/1/1/1/0.33/0.28/7/2400/473